MIDSDSSTSSARDVVNFQCRIDAHKLDPKVAATLMSGMPKPSADLPCKSLVDAGPISDVEAVRQLMPGPLVPFVVVSGNWAMGEWYGGGGGEALYERKNGTWRLVSNGGGAMGVSDLERFGVPKSVYCTFGVFNAKCP